MPVLLAAIRTAAQALGGYLFTWLATHGVNVPVEQQDLLVQAVLISAGMMAYTAFARWLETRQGDGWERWARKLGAWLMLGLSGQQPTYPSNEPTKLAAKK